MVLPELAVFSYPVSDILKEAEKRTSYFGKMRGDKENANFIDRMSLTSGEGFLSSEFVADAVEQVYEWLAAFGRGVENAHTVENDTITYNLQPREWWDRNAFSGVERNIKEALVNFIIYRWFEYVNPAESEAFFNKFEDYAHKAQLGMNAEGTKLHRRVNEPTGTPWRTPVDTPTDLHFKP